jgi:hypothetical protein
MVDGPEGKVFTGIEDVVTEFIGTDAWQKVASPVPYPKNPAWKTTETDSQFEYMRSLTGAQFECMQSIARASTKYFRGVELQDRVVAMKDKTLLAASVNHGISLIEELHHTPEGCFYIVSNGEVERFSGEDVVSLLKSIHIGRSDTDGWTAFADIKDPEDGPIDNAIMTVYGKYYTYAIVANDAAAANAAAAD